LCVWGSDWGISSVDPACLSMMTYSKFSGAPVTAKATNNPFWSPKGSLPVLRSPSSSPLSHPSQKPHEPVEITDFRSCVQHLKACGYSADYNLSSRQQSEVMAFSQLIEERLRPALLQVFWLDTKNQLELSRPWFASKMGLPLSLFYPNKIVGRAREVVRSHVDVGPGNEDCDDAATSAIIEAAVYKRAEECLSVLARRLGDDLYFFGKSPSSLDALVYGHLAPLLKAPLPNPTLQNHLKACVNLVSFVVRITQNYFAETALEYEKVLSDKQAEEAARAAAAASEKGEEDGEGASRSGKSDLGEWLRPFAGGAVACSAMLGYAYFSGLIDLVRNAEAGQLSVNNEDEDDE